ncbi:alanine racemase [bacterium]|nr:alanine racemase [bacterium]
MFHTSFIELSESALRKNFRFLQKKVGKDVLISSVIKGNAYGHGIRYMVPMAEKCGIRHFSVFSSGEALAALNSRTENSKIMIMGHLDNEDIPWAIENRISFYIFDLDRLQAALTAAKKLGHPALLHFELETGLNRMGLSKEDLEAAVDLLKKQPEDWKLEGVCTHFAGAESITNYVRIQSQLQNYHKQCSWLRQQGIELGLQHTAASAAALSYPETRFDMVRVGIAQYGYWPTQEIRMNYYLTQTNGGEKKIKDPLHRVIRWSSRIMHVHTVGPGEFIGYGTSYQTSRTQRVATIPIGYFHGFARTLSNTGHVLINGRRSPVLGVVNMNMILVDVTDIKNAKKGDEAVIIGKQNRSNISVASFSDMANFLNYEVLVRLPGEIPRIVVE